MCLFVSKKASKSRNYSAARGKIAKFECQRKGLYLKLNSFDYIYDVVKNIPCGKVASYGQVALLAGNPRWARVVGYALHVNPDQEKIPCHRVVKKDGSLSPAFAFGGENEQYNLLSAEGVKFDESGESPKVLMKDFCIKI